ATLDRCLLAILANEQRTFFQVTRFAFAQSPGCRIGFGRTGFRMNERKHIGQLFTKCFLLRPPRQLLGGAVQDSFRTLGRLRHSRRRRSNAESKRAIVASRAVPLPACAYEGRSRWWSVILFLRTA